MQKLRELFGGLSPIAITAGLSLVVLFAVTLAHFTASPQATSGAQPATVAPALQADSTPLSEQEKILLGLTETSDPTAITTSDPIALIGPMIRGQIMGAYTALQEKGDYTQEDLQAAAAKIAPYVKAAVSYTPYRASDFTTTPDETSTRVLVYRDELQSALKPLQSIPAAEFEIYGRYVETSDPKYLDQLRDAAAKYRASATAAATLTIPRDSINYHTDLLNALLAFGATLDALATHTNDPYASAALLRTFTENESNVFDAFNGMRAYYAQKAI